LLQHQWCTIGRKGKKRNARGHRLSLAHLQPNERAGFGRRQAVVLLLLSFTLHSLLSRAFSLDILQTDTMEKASAALPGLTAEVANVEGELEQLKS
jgi:hypothetical protein